MSNSGDSLFYWEWGLEWRKSEFERAIELDPNDLQARVCWFGLTEGILGKFDRQMATCVRSFQMDRDTEYLSYLAQSSNLLANWNRPRNLAATMDMQPACWLVPRTTMRK